MSWNGSDRKSGEPAGGARRPSARSGVLKGALAGLVVVVLALAAMVFLRRGDARRGSSASGSRTASSAKIAEVAPSIATNRIRMSVAEREKPLSTNPVWLAAKGLDPKLFPYTDGRKVIQTRTNMWQAIDICILTNGIRRKVRRNVSKQLFRHATDEILLRALSTGGDEVGPPIPFSEDMEDDFRASLKTPITIDEDDTPEQRAAKEQVIAARESVLEQLKEGRTFYDAITDHIATQESNQSARETVMKAVEELKSGGDADLVDKYLEESNKILEKMGASPIHAADLDPDGE